MGKQIPLFEAGHGDGLISERPVMLEALRVLNEPTPALVVIDGGGSGHDGAQDLNVVASSPVRLPESVRRDARELAKKASLTPADYFRAVCNREQPFSSREWRDRNGILRVEEAADVAAALRKAGFRRLPSGGLDLPDGLDFSSFDVQMPGYSYMEDVCVVRFTFALEFGGEDGEAHVSSGFVLDINGDAYVRCGGNYVALDRLGGDKSAILWREVEGLGK